MDKASSPRYQVDHLFSFFPHFSSRQINSRLGAVTELAFDCNDFLSQIVELLKELPDLERGITRIFYQKCTVPEFISVLQAFER